MAKQAMGRVNENKVLILLKGRRRCCASHLFS